MKLLKDIFSKEELSRASNLLIGHLEIIEQICIKNRLNLEYVLTYMYLKEELPTFKTK